MKEEGVEGLEYWADADPWGFGGIALGGRLSVPLIARVNGPALGGGFEMVLGCDLVVASENAVFGLPEPRVGRVPLDARVALPRLIPRALALGILLTGRRIGAAEALGHGLINRGCRRRTGWTQPSIRLGRRYPDLRAAQPEGDQALGLRHGPYGPGRSPQRPSAGPGQRPCAAATPDEGVLAFREKRAPAWTGS